MMQSSTDSQKKNKIVRTPTFQTLNKLKLDLQDNASLIPSNLGGAQNGYLSLVLAAPAYAALVGTDTLRAPQPFITPTFPDTVPTILGIDEVDREAQHQKFEANTYAWCEYNNMRKALCKLIIAAMDNVYIKVKKTRASGYNMVMVNQLLERTWWTMTSVSMNHGMVLNPSRTPANVSMTASSLHRLHYRHIQTHKS
jgi:hypothetical protein